MLVAPRDINVSDVVGLVWATTLEMPLLPVIDDPGLWAEPALEAQVQITGDWQGAVVLQASRSLVSDIARRMFQLGEQPPGQDDMRDAFGEVANITGGNIKGLVSEGAARLSLPSVVQGSSYTVSIPGSRQVARCVFLCGDQPLAVTLLEAFPASGRLH